MADLSRAIGIAALAHAGQTDKGGEPYILHPLRVMLSVVSEEERIVAALHDVVEDCPEWPLERLRKEGFSEAVLEAVMAVTKRDGEDYFSFVERAAANPIARAVKLADFRKTAISGGLRTLCLRILSGPRNTAARSLYSKPREDLREGYEPVRREGRAGACAFSLECRPPEADRAHAGMAEFRRAGGRVVDRRGQGTCQRDSTGDRVLATDGRDGRSRPLQRSRYEDSRTGGVTDNA